MTDSDRTWVRRTDVVLRPDPDRVVARLFLPGQELAADLSRATQVLARVRSMTHDQVTDQLAYLTRTFAPRHRDASAVWDANYALVRHRLDDGDPPGDERRALMGAYFTQEYAVEGAALFNPSMVPHHDQSGVDAGSTRFLMSVRAVGEGHISSVELRTGTVDADDRVSLDPAPDVAVLSTSVPSLWSRAAFVHQLVDTWRDRAAADFVTDTLPERFTRADLDRAQQQLRDQRLTRGPAARMIDRLELLAATSYDVEFPRSSAEQERVLMPRSPAESHGMEDVRLVRMQGDGDSGRYLGTYTAYDGGRVSPQLMETSDFRAFTMTRLSGPGARDKGMALFPRRIDGQYVALSRSDRESNGVTTSGDGQHWRAPTIVQTAHQPWELVQLGNCGPPIETETGWLVLTHGVGPMREYSIGALLLDLHDPTVVIGRLAQPLLSPDGDERSGYVPHVVYSCGALLHGRTLVLPYGCSDTTSRVALVALDPLLDELTDSPASLPETP